MKSFKFVRLAVLAFFCAAMQAPGQNCQTSPDGSLSCPAPPRSPAAVPNLQVYSVRAVRIANKLGQSNMVGSGTIVGVSGREAIVITVKHLFEEGTGQLTVYRTNGEASRGRLIGKASNADLAAVAIPDPGNVTDMPIADEQPSQAVMVGFGGTTKAKAKTGSFAQELNGPSLIYTFQSTEGDSGGGVYDFKGAFAGVNWGKSPRDGGMGVVVRLTALRDFLRNLGICNKNKVKIKNSPITINPPPTVPVNPVEPPAVATEPETPAVDLTPILARLAALEAEAKKPILVGVTHQDGTQTTHEALPDSKYRARIGIKLHPTPNSSTP